MNFMKFDKFLKVATIGAALALAANGTAALADSITVSYLGAGVQTSSSTTYVENFDSGLSATNTTTFNGSSITGTFTGGFTLEGASEYGGAGGTGSFIDAATYQSTYTLTLSTPVNYFGYWLSALDAGNQVQLEDAAGDVLFTFVPQDLITALGTCPTTAAGASNPYCGNPNPSSVTLGQGANNEQLYAYVNFFDTTGSDISKIVYTETIPAAGYEADNFAVDNISTNPGGTTLNPVPEPSSLMLLGTGVVGIAATLRKKLLA